jgi:hypothetical protein
MLNIQRNNKNKRGPGCVCIKADVRCSTLISLYCRVIINLCRHVVHLNHKLGGKLSRNKQYIMCTPALYGCNQIYIPICMCNNWWKQLFKLLNMRSSLNAYFICFNVVVKWYNSLYNICHIEFIAVNEIFRKH